VSFCLLLQPWMSNQTLENKTKRPQKTMQEI